MRILCQEYKNFNFLIFIPVYHIKIQKETIFRHTTSIKIEVRNYPKIS